MSDRPPANDAEDPRAAYLAAADEARVQADALRRALCEAEELMVRCREMLDNLRSILVFPRAYDWPDVAEERGPRRASLPALHVVRGIRNGATESETRARPEIRRIEVVSVAENDP